MSACRIASLWRRKDCDTEDIPGTSDLKGLTERNMLLEGREEKRKREGKEVQEKRVRDFRKRKRE